MEMLDILLLVVLAEFARFIGVVDNVPLLVML